MMEAETGTYLRADIRNVLRSLFMASTAMQGEYQAGYEDALQAVALAFNVQNELVSTMRQGSSEAMFLYPEITHSGQ